MALSQENRLLKVATPLGDDFLMLRSFSAQENLSALFRFDLDLVHEETEQGTEPTVIESQSILGKEVTVEVHQRDENSRFFSGIVAHFSQGNRDRRFTYYQAVVVPQFWLLTQHARSRTFQHVNVPDILKKVLEGLDVVFEIQGTFHPRDYCVQYRETDFNFASRLMEEEGIFYYFEHTASGHRMIVANTPQSHRDCPNKKEVPFFLDVTDDEGFVSSVGSWQINLQLRSGKYTLWDHCFELPGKNLEADKPSRFVLGGNDQLEVYDFPGAYAQRFDGVDKTGGDRSADLQKIFTDNKRTAEIRMQELDATHKTINASSDCVSLTAGHRFQLFNHPVENSNGLYILTSVHHSAVQSPDYDSNTEGGKAYGNNFTCIPHGAGHAPFRPARSTPKPFVQGSQTATVVGPSGEEIFTDKYGRVKVQFHWDREGRRNADSSCWIRVGQLFAGKRWGASFWPRIGQEVIVDFLEGDPDQPIIVGSVYNAEQMPPYQGDGPDSKHKNDNKVSGIKTNSTKGGKGFNELRFDDAKDKEQIFIHAERNMDIRVKKDRMESVGGSRHLTVGGEKREKVGGNKHVHVSGELLHWVEKDNHNIVGGDIVEEFQKNHAQVVTAEYWLKANRVIIEADGEICLMVGGNFVKISAAGVVIEGAMVNINCGNAPSSGAPASGLQSKGPEDPAAADNAVSGSKSAPS
jgi:type VI secretion system secreted protein VgrG